MNIIKEVLLKVELWGMPNPKKRLQKRYWPGSKRADTNICHLKKDNAKVTEKHIQGFCDEFNLKATFSKGQKPKIEINE
jgi:hypothetical protein